MTFESDLAMEDTKAPPSANAAPQRAYREKQLATDPEGFKDKRAAASRARYVSKKQERESETANPYQQGKVYAIRNSVNDAVYVGSTKRELAQRFTQHKSIALKCSCNTRHLYAMVAELGIDCFRIELLEEFPM